MHMKKVYLYTLFITALAVAGALVAQADRMNAKFSNTDDADAFVEGAAENGQGNGAQVTHHDDGTTTVTLPEVATEMMSETAMDAIAEHANGVSIDDCPCWQPADVDVVISECDAANEPIKCFEFDDFQLQLVFFGCGNNPDTIGLSVDTFDEPAVCEVQNVPGPTNGETIVSDGQAADCSAILLDRFEFGQNSLCRITN
jgi:hypothetical protein